MSTIFNNILIVCVGNICRSPTAERILQNKLPDKHITSAGLDALVDHGIDAKAAKVLCGSGYDSDNHKARKLNSEMIVNSDLVLVMETGHKNALMSRYPSASGKVMLLGKWSNDLEIIDPYQKSIEAYSHVFKQIETCCIDWHQRLFR